MEVLADMPTREVLFYVAIPFVAVGVSAAVYGIAMHLKDYRRPSLQRYEVRILLMIPIYILLTWLPLYNIRAIRYYRMARDFFQGFFVASFFQLLVEYLGGEDETVALMALKEPIDNGRRCWCLWKKKPTVFDQPEKVYIRLKRGSMQFTLVMPLIALATMLLDLYDLFNYGSFNPGKSYVWLQVIRLVSALWSMFSLKEFLSIMEEDLEKLRVQANQKMLCIQGVIVGLLLQGILISIIFSQFEVNPSEYTSEDINNFVAVCEMAFVSFAHSIYFSYREFELPNVPTTPSGKLALTRAATDSLLPVDYLTEVTYMFSKKPHEKLAVRRNQSYGTLQEIPETADSAPALYQGGGESQSNSLRSPDN